MFGTIARATAASAGFHVGLLCLAVLPAAPRSVPAYPVQTWEVRPLTLIDSPVNAPTAQAAASPQAVAAEKVRAVTFVRPARALTPEHAPARASTVVTRSAAREFSAALPPAPASASEGAAASPVAMFGPRARDVGSRGARIDGNEASPSAAVERGQSAPTRLILEQYLAMARERVSRHRQYPYLARRARLEGKVCLRLTVSASGQLKEARATCGGSQPALLQAALRAVADATPLPPMPPALGPALTFEVPVVFELTDE